MKHNKRPLPEAGPLELGGELLIPKIVHRIWFGPMRRYHLDNGALFPKIAPDWERVEWHEEHVENVGKHVDLIYKLIEQGRYRHASDIFRLALLDKYGGFYVDSDAVPLRPFEPALRGREFMIVRETRNNLNNSYLGAIPGQPLIAYMLGTVTDRMARFKESEGAENVTGPWWFTETFFNFLDSGITWPLSPPKPFYPYSFMQLIGFGDQELVMGQKEPPEEAIFVHHWAFERSKPSKRKKNRVLDQGLVNG